ncbi:Actin- protein 6 [Malassezia sp. CBS 17886]|nr:Actin- protein 6 [Malassezia sp. CBS 17886]
MRAKGGRRDERPPPAGGVVIDTGAAQVRVAAATPAGRDVLCAPNAIARTRPGIRRQVLVADEIETKCIDYGGLQLRLPVERGMFVDWQAQKAVWDRALVCVFDRLRGESGGSPWDSFNALRGRTVLVTEPYFCLPEQQRAMDALMFEWYGAEALWRICPAQLAAFGVERGGKRPECVLVVDCGHSYTHAVPVVHDRVQWDAVRRLDIGGKVLTSLLKMQFSFRQWNMMDETFLTDKVKAASCFVAAAACGTEERDGAPHFWSFAELVDLFHEHRDNAVVQHYVLPDYARPGDVADAETKYGYVLAGPRRGKKSTPEDSALDEFIAGRANTLAEAAAGEQPPETDHQVLMLGQERYQLCEALFAPNRIGLEQGSLAELVAASINTAPAEAQPLLWSNIVLMGGGARIAGLRRRLHQEVRMLAPDDVPVDVYLADD